MATNKKPLNPTNSAPKTYGKRPVPFQFPGSEEKMYIGSEVRRTIKLNVVHSVFFLCNFRLAIICAYFVEHFIKNIHRYGVVKYH